MPDGAVLTIFTIKSKQPTTRPTVTSTISLLYEQKARIPEEQLRKDPLRLRSEILNVLTKQVSKQVEAAAAVNPIPSNVQYYYMPCMLVIGDWYWFGTLNRANPNWKKETEAQQQTAGEGRESSPESDADDPDDLTYNPNDPRMKRQRIHTRKTGKRRTPKAKSVPKSSRRTAKESTLPGANTTAQKRLDEIFGDYKAIRYTPAGEDRARLAEATDLMRSHIYELNPEFWRSDAGRGAGPMSFVGHFMSILEDMRLEDGKGKQVKRENDG
ncbi:hypothetical protein OH77DRAFT_1588296 [Trametes cingulata]|nr:hypothetical protein OH77DRAFT_1588296 [Trametes cingulata]